MNTELSAIDSAAKRFAAVRETLTAHVTSLNRQIEELKRHHMPFIKRAVSRAAECHSELSAEIEKAPQLFDKPRTIVLHGIKVGLTKGKGKIDWDDDAQVIKLIKKHFPEQREVLINTKETPVKKALAQLEVADLKKLGCTVEITGDVVVIKPTDSDVDKIVSALLNEATDTTEIPTTPIQSSKFDVGCSTFAPVLLLLCSPCFLLFNTAAADLEIRRANATHWVIALPLPTWPVTNLTTLVTATNLAGPWQPIQPSYINDNVRYYEGAYTNCPAMYFRILNSPVKTH